MCSNSILTLLIRTIELHDDSNLHRTSNCWHTIVTSIRTVKMKIKFLVTISFCCCLLFLLLGYSFALCGASGWVCRMAFGCDRVVHNHLKFRCARGYRLNGVSQPITSGNVMPLSCWNPAASDQPGIKEGYRFYICSGIRLSSGIRSSNGAGAECEKWVWV